VSPNVISNVGYKYRVRFSPYATFVANILPEYKINAILQQQASLSVQQFTSAVYAELVYYQQAIKYTYPAASA